MRTFHDDNRSIFFNCKNMHGTQNEDLLKRRGACVRNWAAHGVLFFFSFSSFFSHTHVSISRSYLKHERELAGIPFLKKTYIQVFSLEWYKGSRQMTSVQNICVHIHIIHTINTHIHIKTRNKKQQGPSF